MFSLFCEWKAATVDSNTPTGRTATVGYISFHISFSTNELEIRVIRSDFTPTNCEWSHIAKDIGDFIVASNNDPEDFKVLFATCPFSAASCTCPGWQELLVQVSCIGARASSLRVEFDWCKFAGEDVRQSIAQDMNQTNAVNVVFNHFILEQHPTFSQSDQTTIRLKYLTLSGNLRSMSREFSVYMNNDDNYWNLSCGWPTSRQWQVIAAVTARSIARESEQVQISFHDFTFEHSAGLEIFSEALTEIGVDPTTGIIRRRLEFFFSECSFLDAEAVHSIGTACASNKAVDCVEVSDMLEWRLSDMVDLLSRSATLTKIRFSVPEDSEECDCICRSIAMSTALVSVRLIEPVLLSIHIVTLDCSEFVHQVRSAVVRAAFKTRGKYQDWFMLPVEALPYLCEYVQFGMPRLMVSGPNENDERDRSEKAESDDLYRLTVLYDMLRSRSTLLHHAWASRVPSETYRKREKRGRGAY